MSLALASLPARRDVSPLLSWCPVMWLLSWLCCSSHSGALGATPPDTSSTFDVAVVGLGPNGVRVAGCLASKGLSVVGFDRGALGNTIRVGWPPSTRTQSTLDDVRETELWLPGGLHLADYCNESSGVLEFAESVGARQKKDKNCCSRSQYLRYLQDSAAALGLPLHEHERVLSIRRSPEGFILESQRTGEALRRTLARYVVVAIGCHAVPRVLEVPGSKLPHVVLPGEMQEVQSYGRRHVAVVGCGHSAIEITASLCRAETPPNRVLLICRHDDFKGLAPELQDVEAAARMGNAFQHRQLSPAELRNITTQEFGHEHLDDWARQRFAIDDEKWDWEQWWYQIYGTWAFKELHRCALMGNLVTCSWCEVRSVEKELLHLEVFPDDVQVRLNSWFSSLRSLVFETGRRTSTKWTVTAEALVQATGSKTDEGQLLANVAIGEVSAKTGETAEAGIFAIGFDPTLAPPHHGGPQVYQNWLSWGRAAVDNTCKAINRKYKKHRREL